MLGIFASGPLMWVAMLPLMLLLAAYRLISPERR